MENTLNTVLELLNILYTPGADNNTIQKVQKELQKYQKIDSALDLADLLLKTSPTSSLPSPVNAQFFGALIYTIQLNTFNFTQENLNQIFQRLVYWILIYKDDNELVLNKLINALSICLIKSSQTDIPFVLIVSLSFSLKEPLNINSNNVIECKKVIDETGNIQLIHDSCQNIDLNGQKLLFNIIKCFLDEATSSEFTKEKSIELNTCISYNFNYISEYIGIVLNSNNKFSNNLLLDAIKCLYSLISHYIKSATSIDNEAINWLHSSILNLIQLTITDANLLEYSSECISDTIDYLPNVLTKKDIIQLLNLLVTDWGNNIITSILEENIDTLQLNGFLNIFISSSLRSMDLIYSFSTELQISLYFNALYKLSAMQGHAFEDDEVTPRMLEFWEHFAEFITDKNDPNINNQIIEVLETIAGIYFTKIQIPTSNILNNWDKDTKDKFFAFRKDVKDFLETIFPFAGKQLTIKYSSLISSLINASQDPFQIEACLYILSSFAESISDSDDDYDFFYFKQIFSESFFTFASTTNLLVKRTIISFISDYSIVFNELTENSAIVSNALDFLFASLAQPSLSLISSKTIFTLCSSCGVIMSNYLSTLISLLEEIIKSTTVDDYSKEKIVGAISAIIGFLKNSHEICEYLDKVLTILLNTAITVNNSMNENNINECADYAASILRCLVAAGKGLNDSLDTTNQDFENVDPAEVNELRSKIQFIINSLLLNNDKLKTYESISSAACNVVRIGFVQKSSHPFSFNYIDLFQFISFGLSLKPHIASVYILLASRFILVHANSKIDSNYELVNNLLSMLRFTINENEPELTQALLEFLQNTVKFYINIFLAHQFNEQYIVYTLASLGSSETLTIKASSKFWIELINAKPKEDQTKKIISHIVSSVGPDLMRIILVSITGKSLRSELDFYSNILKRLIAQYPIESKRWLQKLLIESTDFEKINVNKRKQFFDKVILLRGSYQTSNVVKDFWISSKGKEYQYI